MKIEIKKEFATEAAILATGWQYCEEGIRRFIDTILASMDALTVDWTAHHTEWLFLVFPCDAYAIIRHLAACAHPLPLSASTPRTSMLASHAACEPIFAAHYGRNLFCATVQYDYVRERKKHPYVYQRDYEYRHFDTSQFYWAALTCDGADGWSRPEHSPEAKATKAALAALNATPQGQALVTALDTAPWGAQPDGSFITSNHNAHWIADSGDYVQLHAPAKQGTIAGATVHCGGTHELSFFASRVEARDRAAVDRAARSTAQAKYEARRQSAGAALAAGRGLRLHLGQKGGHVEFDGGTVSARGAIAAAGVPRAVFESWVEHEQTVMDLYEPGRRYHNYHKLTWYLFRDGMAAVAPDGRVYAFGLAAKVWFGLVDPEPRVRDPRNGKIVYCRTRHTRERRISKRVARRAERRFGREELRSMM